jgi:thymidylate synthase (FAD)
MKIITEPRVIVIGKTQFIEHPDYKIPPDGSDACKIGSFAAKMCYDSFGEEGRANTENQEKVLDNAHGSVLEHSTVVLALDGITRAVTLEMNRHRPLGISQRSTRYTKEEESAIVLEPYQADIYSRYTFKESESGKFWYTSGTYTVDENGHSIEVTDEEWYLLDFLVGCQDAFERYKKQIELLEKLNPNKLEGFALRKWARGKARNVLPHALETRAVYSGNHRAWRWFIELRSGADAEPEIRRLANYVLRAVKEVAPEYYADFEIEKVHDGIPVWKPNHHKV